jgi:competence protein ComEC
VMQTAKDAFLLKEWLAADADERQPTDSSLAGGVSCAETGCVVQMAYGALAALALKPEAFVDDCERAALLVTLRQAPPGCSSAVIDGERLRRQGTLALRRTRDGFTADAIRPRGVDRPWSRAVGGDTEDDSSFAPRIAVPRAVDATPAESDVQADE